MDSVGLHGTFGKVLDCGLHGHGFKPRIGMVANIYIVKPSVVPLARSGLPAVFGGAQLVIL